jgi:hypothetical protein
LGAPRTVRPRLGGRWLGIDLLLLLHLRLLHARCGLVRPLGRLLWLLWLLRWLLRRLPLSLGRLLAPRYFCVEEQRAAPAEGKALLDGFRKAAEEMAAKLRRELPEIGSALTQKK